MLIFGASHLHHAYCRLFPNNRTNFKPYFRKLAGRRSLAGLPPMSLEGANNTLEYWSVDDAGNEEPHKFLNEIKLDKSAPSITVRIGSTTEMLAVELK